ncbi:hypothetical protein ACFV4P_21445 [Kitasatospora sp. NPDC059795]|uniref:hypothetical protein n=1 Tax=Kitasatospora sp. NPDC059795 TaxID=3346949 RepID=UPI0036593A36
MTTPEPADPFTPPPGPPSAPASPLAPGVPLAGAGAGPKNLPGAVLAGLGVALVSGLLYGFIAKATDYEITWMAIGIAAAVGVTVGRIGGKHPVLPPVGALLSVLGLFFGQLFGIALYVQEVASISVPTMFTEHFSILLDGWKEAFSFYWALFIVVGAVAGFNITRKFGES